MGSEAGVAAGLRQRLGDGEHHRPRGADGEKGAGAGRGVGGARGRVRLPQNDPKWGEKEGKRWGLLQSHPNKHPLEGIVFWGELDASNPPCLDIFGLDDPNLTQSNSNPWIQTGP